MGSAAIPAEVERRLRLVRRLSRRGQHGEALAALADGLRLDPTSAELLAEQTSQFGRVGQLEAMHASLTSLASSHPTYPRLPRLRGAHAEAVGDLETALRIYAADAAAYPDDAERRVRWVRCLRKSGRIEEALEVLGRQPSTTAAERKLHIECLAKVSRWTEAHAILDAWPDTDEPTDRLEKLRLQMQLAVQQFDYSAALKYAEAEKLLSTSLSSPPHSPDLLLQLWKRCRKRERVKVSKAVLEVFEEHYPHDARLPGLRTAQAEFLASWEARESAGVQPLERRLRQVRRLSRRGRHSEALAALADGLRLDPTSAELLAEQTSQFGKMGQLEAMHASLASLADFHPTHPRLPQLRAAHAEAVGDIETALTIYAADAAAYPDDAERRVRWVLCLRKSGRIDDALEVLGRQPATTATERKLHIECLAKVGRWTEALAILDAWPDTVRPNDRLSRIGILATRLKANEAVDLRIILECLADIEGLRLAAPILTGRWIVELMSTEEGRRSICTASKEALERYPDSPLLIYLHASTLAKGGNFQEAHDVVVEAIRKCQSKGSALSAAESKRQFDSLNKTWRVVDEISRDNMTWANATGYGDAEEGGAGEEPAGFDDSAMASRGDDGRSEEGGEAELEVDAAADPESGEDTAEQASAVESDVPATEESEKEKFIFAEGLLQGRHQDSYLRHCKRQFDEAEQLSDKFKAINAMLRQGIRRVPNYQDAYMLGRHCFSRLKPQCVDIRTRRTINAHIDKAGIRSLALARLLRSGLQIAQRLELQSEATRFEKALLYLGNKPKAVPALWTVAVALGEQYQPVTVPMLKAASRKPEKQHEIRDFFLWALAAQRYDMAHELFEGLPEKSRRSKACTQYARILQREGQFKRAATLIRHIHEALLARPHSVDPKASWGLIRRAGELDFAAESASWLSRFPQPKNPTGVVFVAPRSIEQTRRFPLVVLMEMRKKGWAIVPLVKGVLPLDRTGDPRIDRFLGCLTPECAFDRKAAKLFKPIEGFQPDVAKGQLRWNNINLDHLIWEESAINRRRYNIDYTCPVLRKYNGRLAEWTRLTGTILENINRVLVSSGIECGFMVLQQSRLPDAVVRFYLKESGDPDRFFCIHSANGYQNYFVNFASHVSTKTTLRNMTLHRELRSASFPVPSEFEAFYRANRSRGAEMLNAVREVTQMRRSTAGQTERLPEAQACIDRIRRWRNKGGKVACLFGKVVCDSMVPFDGGPAHATMKDWLNHAIESVRDSKTLLLIKPHPHELRHDIASFLTEAFEDLIEVDLPENVIILGHRWFDLQDLDGLIDVGVIYNGTSAAELGVLGIPCILCGHFGPIDYPIGHAVPKSREHFRRIMRFSQKFGVAKDLKERSAAWIYFMSGDNMARDYRYHSRQITNRVVYPPWWFRDDIERYITEGDPNVEILVRRALETSTGYEDITVAAE